jgi:hypothetical protein
MMTDGTSEMQVDPALTHSAQILPDTLGVLEPSDN